jgi:hypothetical protein
MLYILLEILMANGYGTVGGMRISRGNQSTQRKPVPEPLCSPKIPHDLTCDRVAFW